MSSTEPVTDSKGPILLAAPGFTTAPTANVSIPIPPERLPSPSRPYNVSWWTPPILMLAMSIPV